MNISVKSDLEDMQVPWLAVASNVLRDKFMAKGDSLPVAALDINDHFNGMAGFNKDSLRRAIWAGYKQGLQSVSIALPAFYFLCRFYNVDERALMKRMREEKLRRWLFAELAKQGISVDDFLAPLHQVLPFAEVATLTGWLYGTGYEGNLNNYYDGYDGALHLACEKAGIQTTPDKLQKLVASALD